MQLLRSTKNGGMEDGVHPYGEGIAVYAATVAAAIKTLVMKEQL